MEPVNALHHTRRYARRSSGGLSLLELLLAITVLTTITTLVAALWSQVDSWTRDHSEHHRSLRIARLLEMVRSQWGDRRTVVRLGDAGATVHVTPDSVTFVTATPILEPGWPMAMVRYIVERDYSAGLSLGARWNLVYEETPIVDVKRPQYVPEPGEARVDFTRSVMAPSVRRLVLLNGCTELKWERFGMVLELEEVELARASGKTAEPTEIAEDLLEVEAALLQDKSKSERTWRVIEPEFRTRTPAVRLSGTFEEQTFSCVMVIGDSH